MPDNYPIRLTKHIIKKIIGRPDYGWLLYDFQHAINATTRRQTEEIVAWAEAALAAKENYESVAAYVASTDPVVKQGYELKKKTEAVFRNKLVAVQGLRILIHVPPEQLSPGGYSALTNLAEGLQFVGILTEVMKGDLARQLETFQPTVLLAIDHAVFLKDIRWQAVADYRRTNALELGLMAQLPDDGNTALAPRFEWAKEHGVDFYFSFKDARYLKERAEYKEFYNRGYKIISVPFGGNVLHYYPVAGVERDLEYIFLASINKTKAKTYNEFAKTIVKKYHGLVYGPGWNHVSRFSFNRDRDRYLYARAKTGLNFSHPLQLRWTNEVNERLHQLALCGVPQITDRPKLLASLYTPEAFFVADAGKEFLANFRQALHNPALAQKKALQAQREAFEKHTIFHRAEDFVKQLQKIL